MSAMATQSLKSQVITLYKRILSVARKWEAQDPNERIVESDFIMSEAKTLFRANKNLKTETEILERLKEGEARLAMAEHYGNPYPRPANLPKRSFSKREGKKVGKAIQKAWEQARPVYIRSVDSIRDGKTGGE